MYVVGKTEWGGKSSKLHANQRWQANNVTRCAQNVSCSAGRMHHVWFISRLPGCRQNAAFRSP